MSRIVIRQLSYMHPNGEILFDNVTMNIRQGEKASLIGNNGSGKSTLLRIIVGKLPANRGECIAEGKIQYIPQHFGQYNQLNVAQALGIRGKLDALHAILNGDASVCNLDVLGDDWNVEDIANEALQFWNISHIRLDQAMSSLSGGEKTKIFLASSRIHEPSIILMDEPTNHLDTKSRKQLYDYIRSSKATMLIVSHDRALLNLISPTWELSVDGAELYGGNYDFYRELKDRGIEILKNQLENHEKALHRAKQAIQETNERRQKEDSRGKKQSEKKGIPRIMMGNRKDSAERNTSKLKEVRNEKMQDIHSKIKEASNKVPDNNSLKINLESAALHSGKILVKATDINFSYKEVLIWEKGVSLLINSGDRIAIKGNNGTGKTTLVRLILGQIEPSAGQIYRSGNSAIYIDQEYSEIKDDLSVFEQITLYNSQKLAEHELKNRLHHFRLSKNCWSKKCRILSGGEKMKLIFCCMAVQNSAPDMIILDEPTNNLDIESLGIVASTLKQYRGTLVLISHDDLFAEECGVNSVVRLGT